MTNGIGIMLYVIRNDLHFRAREMTEVSEEDLYVMSTGQHYPVFVEDTEHGYLSKRPTVHG